MAFTVLPTILFYLVTSSVAHNDDNPVTASRDIAKEFEDFKIYISSRMEAMAENHAREIGRLEDIIHSQGKQIQKLESDDALKTSEIKDLLGKLEEINLKNKDGIKSTEKSQKPQKPKGKLTKPQPPLQKRDQALTRNLYAAHSFTTRPTTSMIQPGPHSMVGRASAETKVAFFATVTTFLNHLGKDQDIIFGNAVTNVGNGYLPNHGTFEAPVSGTYVFSVTLLHWQNETTFGQFVVNGSIVARLYVKSQQTSQNIIVNLRKGENVSVQNTELDRTFTCSQYCTFSGFLLYEDSSVDQIVG